MLPTYHLLGEPVSTTLDVIGREEDLEDSSLDHEATHLGEVGWLVGGDFHLETPWLMGLFLFFCCQKRGGGFAFGEVPRSYPEKKMESFTDPKRVPTWCWWKWCVSCVLFVGVKDKGMSSCHPGSWSVMIFKYCKSGGQGLNSRSKCYKTLKGGVKGDFTHPWNLQITPENGWLDLPSLSFLRR